MDDENIMKIAVVGLAAAGKTSLIRTLQRRYHIGESLAPTRNVERTSFQIFGREGNIWDFGGQDQYRSIYLNKPERYFAEIRYLYYVIDIQDSAHFPDSIDYFRAVFQNTRNLSKELILSVIFNKVDPNISENPEILAHIDSLTKEIMKIAEDVDIAFHKSSIYDPVTILEAFSQPILGDTPIYNTLSVKFANFAMMHDVEYITLIVNDLFEAGSFKVRHGNENFIAATVKFYQQFASLEIHADSIIRAYEFENYKFLIRMGKVQNYEYMLNLVYPTAASNPPNEENLAKLLDEIENDFKKYQPSFA